MLIQDIIKASNVVKDKYNEISSRNELRISIQMLNKTPNALKSIVKTKWS